MKFYGDQTAFPDEILESMEIVQIAVHEGCLACAPSPNNDGTFNLIALIRDEQGRPTAVSVGRVLPPENLSARHEPTPAVQPSTAIH